MSNDEMSLDWHPERDVNLGAGIKRLRLAHSVLLCLRRYWKQVTTADVADFLEGYNIPADHNWTELPKRLVQAEDATLEAMHAHLHRILWARS